MRISPITPGSRPELAEQEARIESARGRVSPLYQVLLNSPALADGWEAMLSAVRNRNSIPAGLRELAILRVAMLNGAPYEFDAHVPHALSAGLSQAAIDATRDISKTHSVSLDPMQQLVLRLTDRMTRDIVVPAALYEEVHNNFDAKGQIDLVATIAAYNMVSRFLVALEIGH